MPRYRLKFMFDWGAGTCLWSGDEETQKQFGDYPIMTSELPISEALKAQLEELIDEHDEALNWDDPAGPLLWNDEQIQLFLVKAKHLFQLLCSELGTEYAIEFWNQM